MSSKLLFLTALCLTLLPTGRATAQSTNRLALLQNSKNVVVSTTDGQQHYYIVNSARTYTVHRTEGKVVIDRDTFNTADIASIRFHNIPRIAMDEDSSAVGSSNAVTSGLLALRRSFNVGQWNSIAVPFSLTAAQVRDAFGDDCLVACADRITEGDVATVEYITISASDDRDVIIEKDKPYLIRPTREPDVAEGRSTTIDYGSGRVSGPVYVIPGVTVEKGNKYFPNVILRSDSKETAIRIKGTYTATNVSPGSKYPVYMLNDEGHFCLVEETAPTKGFRTWIEDVKNEQQLPWRFFINGIEEDLTMPTAISEVNHELITDNRYYDLQGRCIPESDIRKTGLKKGLYIVNGKKTIVR